MIPYLSQSPMVVPTEEKSPIDIVAEIVKLTAMIESVDRRLAKLETRSEELFSAIGRQFEKHHNRIERVEKRHTAHLHWTNMGR